MSDPAPIITIDGPTASGKGTVARAVAQALGFHLLDSGAIYRALAYSSIKNNIKPNQIKELEHKAQVLDLKFVDQAIWLEGEEVSAALRAEAVGMAASQISALPEVRQALLDRQRAFAQAPGLVGDGRDMGTVIFPGATLKIYLTASAAVRAARRTAQVAKQLIEKENSPTIAGSPERLADEVEAKIRARDLQDKTRSVAPLKPAPDAIIIDNAGHGPDDTVQAVLRLWQLRSQTA